MVVYRKSQQNLFLFPCNTTRVVALSCVFITCIWPMSDIGSRCLFHSLEATHHNIYVFILGNWDRTLLAFQRQLSQSISCIIRGNMLGALTFIRIYSNFPKHSRWYISRALVFSRVVDFFRVVDFYQIHEQSLRIRAKLLPELDN